MASRLIIFLLLNFAALAIGIQLSGSGSQSEWYQGLAKAPWTPPGWVFGSAWAFIMICFSIYMAYLWPGVENKNLLIALFVFQFILNVGWNPAFFYYHKALAGLIIISGLTVLVALFLVYYWPELKLRSLFILPYLIWLCIATSLNSYILIKN
jgi:tryptophan-rich sensory protein